MEKKNIFFALGLVVVIGGSYFGYEYATYVDTDNAQVDARTVMLASKVTGFIKTINVKEGQEVKAGDVLLQIDERDYQNTLK